MIAELEKLSQQNCFTWQPKVSHRKAPTIATTPTLSRFAQDLTLEAEQNLRPFVGRNEEIRQIASSLERREKCHAILLGEPGVGKTTILKGIAQRIVANDPTLPPIFRNKRIFSIDYSSLTRQIPNNYQFDEMLQQRLESILSEAKSHKESVILFIDEVHAFFMSRPGNRSLAETLKPALADGSITIMGATTTMEYKKLINENPALERRLPTIEIKEPPRAEVKQILGKVAPFLEARHGVQITNEAIEEAVELSQRYFKSQSNPDIAIDLLDQAAAELKSRQALSPQDRKTVAFLELLLKLLAQVDDSQPIQEKIDELKSQLSQRVTADLIRQMVARKTNLPLQQIQQSEKELLNRLEEKMEAKIIGQKSAIQSLCRAIRRSRIKLSNPDIPGVVILTCGPTGVGKTEAAKNLARIIYGAEEKFLRLDMSEYSHSSDISKLIGAPVGYSGHNRGGMLTNWLKQNPHSIVLFDEIEKASSDVHQLLLGLFDAGRLTDGNGQTIKGLDAIFIMTSNLGSLEITEHSGKKTEEELRIILENSLSKTFKPEFIGRIQETIIFHPLNDEEVYRIVVLRCNELKQRVENNPHCQNLKMEWEATVIAHLAKTYYSKARGARAIAGVIRNTMENTISDGIIAETIRPGDTIRFIMKGSDLVMDVQR